MYPRRRQSGKLYKGNVDVVVGVLAASKRVPPFLPHKLKLLKLVYVDEVVGVFAASKRIPPFLPHKLKLLKSVHVDVVVGVLADQGHVSC